MDDHLELEHPVPSVDAVRVRLAATMPWDEPAGAGAARRPLPVSALIDLLEQHDREAAEHTFRVAGLATAIGARLGLDAAQLARLRLASLLHDIGKLSVPDEVLRKPGPLTDGEWRRVRAHPEYGFQMVAASVHEEVAEIVRTHCERIDGNGYPNGRRGQEIPLAARVLLVADAYDAMLSPRPYREPLSAQNALAAIRAGSDTEFDAGAVQALHLVAYEQRWYQAS